MKIIVGVIGGLVRVIATLIICLLSPSQCFADLYRCTLQNGKVEFQQQPCSIGSSQRTVDDSDTQKRLKDEKLKRDIEERYKQITEREKKAKEEGITKIQENAKTLVLCSSKLIECPDYMYQQSLKCMTTANVENILGPPQSSQNIGGQKYIYYSVPVHNGTRFISAKLQLVIGYCDDIKNSTPSNRVKEVNVW